MLELRQVTKLYSGIPAVKDVSFVARPGEVTGYLGPNGSGKSTTLRMILGLIEPSDGEILFQGVPIGRDRIAHRQRIGYVPEEPHLYGHLTGLEYLEMVGQLRGIPDPRLTPKIEGFLRLLSLYPDRNVPISSYSKGMRQKILVAAALLHNPEIVLLDEPFSGLDVSSAQVLRSLLQDLAARNKIVLFSSHELDVVERICFARCNTAQRPGRCQRFHRAIAYDNVTPYARGYFLSIRRATGHACHHAPTLRDYRVINKP